MGMRRKKDGFDDRYDDSSEESYDDNNDESNNEHRDDNNDYNDDRGYRDDRYDDIPADEGWGDDSDSCAGVDDMNGGRYDEPSDRDDRDDSDDRYDSDGRGGGGFDESDESGADDSGKKRKLPGLRALLLIAIIALLAFVVIKIGIWNNGQKYVVDPSEASKYDTETLDNFIPLSDTLKGDHQYDDNMTILCLGNAPFSDNAGSGLCEQIADAATPTEKKVTMLNAAFPGSTIAQKNGNYDEAAYPEDIYALPYVADAICSGNYDLLAKTTQDTRADDQTTVDALNVLKSTDMNSVDVICIFYDAADYFQIRVGTNPGDTMERCSTTGALRTAITEFQTKYPYIRIIVMSPYYMQQAGADGNMFDPAVTDLGNGNLAHYLELEAGVTNDMSVSIVDNYYGSITPDNYKTYVGDDGKLNADAYKLLAKRFTEALEAESAQE